MKTNKDMTVAVVIAIWAICNLCPKIFLGFNGNWTSALALALQSSTNWAMKTHALGAGQFVEFILTSIFILGIFKIQNEDLELYFRSSYDL